MLSDLFGIIHLRPKLKNHMQFTAIATVCFAVSSRGLFYQLSGAFAEFEHDCIRERVRAGTRSARAKGRHIGRPRVIVDVARIGQAFCTGNALGEDRANGRGELPNCQRNCSEGRIYVRHRSEAEPVCCEGRPNDVRRPARLPRGHLRAKGFLVSFPQNAKLDPPVYQICS